MRLSFAHLAMAFGLAGAVITSVEAADRPVVVELFTSQGCSSCPPADALLEGLANQPDILALSFHVDYWDRLGWRDPFSSAAATARQRDYAGSLGLRGLYTPQAVIDGRLDVVGSNAAGLRQGVTAARRQGQAVPIELRLAAGRAVISVAAGPAETVRIWLVTFDARHVTPVGRGENGGRTLTNVNVVRSLDPVGEWRGAALTLNPALGAGERVAVLLQAADGRILGAAVGPRDAS